MPVGQTELDRMRVASVNDHDAALDVGAVADADDVEFLREPGRDTLHRVGGQRAGQAVQRREAVVRRA